MLWNGSSGSAIDLQPTNLTGLTASFINSTDGLLQVGYGTVAATNNTDEALLWSGTAGSAINLNPTNLSGFVVSNAYGVKNGVEVGYGQTGGQSHALLWTGTPGSAVDLNPTTGIANSLAWATDGTFDVGYAEGTKTGGNYQAYEWTGTAASALNINPTNISGYTTSYAVGINSSQIVGYGSGSATGGNDHALYWTNAYNAVDLNPTNLTGITTSMATGNNSTEQVGYGSGSGTADDNHALVWTGTANSAVDLNSLIPGAATSSTAQAIDDYGDISGHAYINNVTYAVEWLAGDMYNVSSGSGTWNSSSNWLSGIPSSGNDVLLVAAGNISMAVTYQNPNPAIVLGNFTLDANYGGGSFSFTQGQDTLNASNELIGKDGVASFTQTGGVNNVTGTMTIGMNTTSNGTYTLGGSATLTVGTIAIDFGSFQQTGGTCTAAAVTQFRGSYSNSGTLSIGSGTGKIASYIMSGGTVSANVLSIDPTYTFRQTNGVATFGKIIGNGTLNIMDVGTTSLQASGGLSTVAALSITGVGALDLNNNELIIDYGSTPDPISSIATLILDGYDGGLWKGNGIKSSAAQLNSLSYGIGYADSADPGNPAGLSSGQIEVLYTLLGDANLDGKVNGIDFNLMATNFNQAVTNGWDEGDFNYDGKVNGIDFDLLAQNFNQSASQSAVSDADITALDSFAAANGISLASVPEPGNAVIALPLLAGALIRRRVKNRQESLSAVIKMPAQP